GGESAERFRNRKGYFSLNVQAICNANLEIIDVVARYDGSTHDSRIFRESKRRALFEQGVYGDAVLVGDSGYASANYMMIPLQECHTPAENLYNESQIRTRNVVERFFGVWKRRFPVMALDLRVKLMRVFPIITATLVLHNIARIAGEEVLRGFNMILPAPWEEILAQDNIDIEYAPNPINRRVTQQNSGRQALIDGHFER
ncbi:putative nuclease HARBI1, partial [Metopolophium dirhodum]|uniref:putative nuclease HARBI1 n=1 Tax=Metopolophium dirhodum TaxID=44670 RepID=UPI00299028C1